MTTSAEDIEHALEALMDTSSADFKATGTLQHIRDNLSRYLNPLPEGLHNDQRALLNLLRETKTEGGEMWQQICTVNDKVQHLRHQLTAFHASSVASQNMVTSATTAAMAATTAAIAATADANAATIAAQAAIAKATAAAQNAIANAAAATSAANMAAATATAAADRAIAAASVSAAEQQASKERLTIRQVYHALNEKLLRLVITLSGMTPKAFWALDVSNISKIEKHPSLRKAWTRVQSMCGTKLSPKELWDNIVEGKSEFDTFVHKGSFEVVGYEQLLEISERVFVGEQEKLKSGFLKLAALSKFLSEKANKNLFEY